MIKESDKNIWFHQHFELFFFFLKFKMINVPSVSQNCSIVPQQDLNPKEEISHSHCGTGL